MKILSSHQKENILTLYISLEQLKSSIGQICFQGQRRSHFELICNYLERDLIQCTKIYSEQKCLRYKRESERKRIGRLDYDKQLVMFDFNKTSIRKTTIDSKSTSTNENRFYRFSNEIHLIFSMSPFLIVV